MGTLVVNGLIFLLSDGFDGLERPAFIDLFKFRQLDLNIEMGLLFLAGLFVWHIFLQGFEGVDIDAFKFWGSLLDLSFAVII